MSAVLCVCIGLLIQYSSLVEADKCSEIKCSNIVDYVCGEAVRDNVRVIKLYQNICHLNKIKCKVRKFAYVGQVDDALCNITRKRRRHETGRRTTDFSIVGAHQACNHTCPTFCVDTYEPACAQIWTTPESYKYRPMINHCHIDLLSCATGVNVTVNPLGKCFKNPSGLMFMSQIAAMKSLQLIEDAVPTHVNKYVAHRRRSLGLRQLADTVQRVLEYERP